MKKTVAIIIVFVLAATLFAGCSKTGNDKEIIVGASPTPHAEILKVAQEVLKEKGYTLTIKEFTDYVQPNLTLESGDLDANYFQHKPYLDNFNKENKTKLVSIAAIHYEPFGIYSEKIESLAELKEGAKVAVPNDATNEARALLLLEAQGLIKLNPDAGLEATKNDITENKLNLDIVEIEAAQLARSLPDVDIAAINGNYAIQAGLNAVTDALAREEKDSLTAQTYANIIAVREGEENSPKLKALVEALQSDKVREFIETQYEGTVIPLD